MRSHSKVRKTLKELEENQDALAKKVLGDSDDESDIVSDQDMADIEGQERGRKRRKINDDEDMEVDEVNGVPVKSKSMGRSKTPAQRSVSAKKMSRSLTQDRREGNKPKRLASKPVTDAQLRVTHQILKKSFGRQIQKNEADREIQCKKPKHLFAGKMSNGTRDHR